MPNLWQTLSSLPHDESERWARGLRPDAVWRAERQIGASVRETLLQTEEQNPPRWIMDVGCLVDDHFFPQWVKVCCTDVNWHCFLMLLLCCCFSSANVGFQPQQFDQEEQRAGKPHGEVDPDVPTCGGKAGFKLLIWYWLDFSDLF